MPDIHYIVQQCSKTPVEKVSLQLQFKNVKRESRIYFKDSEFHQSTGTALEKTLSPYDFSLVDGTSDKECWQSGDLKVECKPLSFLTSRKVQGYEVIICRH